MTRLAFALVLASIGCGVGAPECYRLDADGREIACGLVIDASKLVDAPARAGEAIQAVADSYGLRSLPSVYWYGRGLDCGGGNGFINQNGDCHSGDELDGVLVTVVPPDGMPLSQFTDRFGCALLTHEMAHAASEQAGQGGCPGHDCPWFQGPCQDATARLAEMGL